MYKKRSFFAIWFRPFFLLLVLGGLFLLNSRSQNPLTAFISTHFEKKEEPARVNASVQAKEVPEKIFRVGIQAGHWKSDEVPAELDKLYWSTGASAGGFTEWEINLEIAQAVGKLLEKADVAVDILPVTIPKGYQADAFVSVHADGNDDITVSGYKVAASEWDTNQRAQHLADAIDASYAATTGLPNDSYEAISENMTQYYAFNSIKYLHAISKNTPGVLVEVGYITNPSDRKFLTRSQSKVVQGITDGILKYLELLPTN